MRTARVNGVSVTTLAKQFDVHRSTIWAKTRSRAPVPHTTSSASAALNIGGNP